MRNGREVSLAIAAWAGLIAVSTALPRGSGGTGVGLPAAASFPLLALAVCYALRAQRNENRSRSLARDMLQLELAEQLAGIGRWSIDLVSGRHRWSEKFCAIAGLPPGTRPEPGVVSALLGGSGAQVSTVLHRHREDRASFPVEFEIMRKDGDERILRARAQNIFSPAGETEQILLVVRDVTEEYRLLETMSRERAEALEQAREAQFLANTDPLTGLANRRFVMSELDRAVFAARNEGMPLSLVMFDIDHFKSVNDTHGHQIGDVVLRKVADLARGRARAQDMVARIGGEEFVWVMPGADAEEAGLAAERLRWTIEAGTLSAPFPAVTISAGNATLAPSDASLSLFARADAALYDAKRGGRNQVRMAA